MPSEPPTPVAGLLGPVVWVSQALWQRSGLPTNAYLTVSAIERRMGMEAAILGAESERFR
ncbi:MAG: hypothetical protein ACXVKH_06500 [Candidatus Angelobacter sp.]